MAKTSIKTIARVRRHRRLRAGLVGTAKRPRLSVSRSLKHISAQIIDDQSGKTLVAVSDLKPAVKGTKSERAAAIGQAIAAAALAKKIKAVVFDRGGYQYHGRVKVLAEAARQAGLEF